MSNRNTSCALPPQSSPRKQGDTSGTRPYMAPEQWAGERQTGHADQYALAVLFYELVSGDVPFAGAFETGDPIIMSNAVMNLMPKELSELTAAQNAALLQAFAKDPKARFASCGAFVDVLQNSAEPAHKTDVISSSAHETADKADHRGLVTNKTSELVEYQTYSAEAAQARTDEINANKGPTMKLSNKHALFIEHVVVVERLSPYVAVRRMIASGEFDWVPCVRTVYNAIDNGDLEIVRANLPYGKTVRKQKKKGRRMSYRTPKERSIEHRPALRAKEKMLNEKNIA